MTSQDQIVRTDSTKIRTYVDMLNDGSMNENEFENAVCSVLEKYNTIRKIHIEWTRIWKTRAELAGWKPKERHNGKKTKCTKTKTSS